MPLMQSLNVQSSIMAFLVPKRKHALAAVDERASLDEHPGDDAGRVAVGMVMMPAAFHRKPALCGSLGGFMMFWNVTPMMFVPAGYSPSGRRWLRPPRWPSRRSRLAHDGHGLGHLQGLVVDAAASLMVSPGIAAPARC